jgi:4-amino-4-deoxy-L-arabinose transferase-like glycosyltransferase
LVRFARLARLFAGAALFLYGPFYRQLHGHGFQEDLPIDRTLPSSKSNYDLITPVELIVAGRIVTAVLSVASMILAGIIAARLANSKAALFAMLLVAVCPALVTRASIVIVDTFAAFFVLVTLYFCLRTQTGMSKSVWREIGLAGFACGLTFASKYPVSIVGVAVLTSILRLSIAWSNRVRLVAFAAGGALLGILLGAPMTFIKPLTVWRDVVENVRAYAQIQSTQGYIAQAISMSEASRPLLVVGLAGIILMLVAAIEPEAPLSLGWCLSVSSSACSSILLFGVPQFLVSCPAAMHCRGHRAFRSSRTGQ